MEWMSNAQNQLQALATEQARKKLPKESKPHRWGYTRWADQYYIQEYLKQHDFPLMLGHPQSPEPDQFESAREDSEEESMSMEMDTDDSTETRVTTSMETDHTV